ncbi:MAG: RagB/SusD family nutrient uptake outer membrane protein [Schleiferiaceae bacterium]|nr:RagB/SusD family nutrient uptake outer membrane protein [Schleiferiaceae bacterium]
MKRYKLFFAVAAIGWLSACDFLELEPQSEGELLARDALNTPDDLQKLLISVYDVQANFLGGQYQNLTELLADNVAAPVNNADYLEVYGRSTNFFNGTVGGVYRDAYITIYRANVLIESVDLISELTEDNKNRIVAEARFLRGTNHWFATRLWAHPYGYTPNNDHLGIAIRTEASQTPVARSTVAEAYDVVIEDLEFAMENLPDINSIYATKTAAKAMLAKVYFEMRDYEKAAQLAGEVIQSGNYALDNLNRFEGGGSTEAIFTLVSTPPNDERAQGFLGNYRSDVNPNPTLKSTLELFTLARQDTSDLRGKEWFRVLNPGESNEAYGVAKFDFNFMNVPVVHLSDLMLLWAESKARLARDLPDALDLLNEVRQRAGVTPLSISGQIAILDAVQKERRLELAFEGDRLFQLKRQALEGEISTIRNAPWDCNGMLLQFPVSEQTGGGFQMNPQGGCN